MKTDLKTNIKFFQVSNRYYRPENEIELASLTRYEKVPTTVVESADQGAHEAALDVAGIINECVEAKGQCVIGLGAGRYSLKVYDELVKLYFADKVSFAHVIAFNLSELVTDGNGALSIDSRIHDHLYAKVDIEPANIHTFHHLTAIENVHNLCKAYERDIIDAGGLDVVLCDLNSDGSIAFNEPGSARTSSCRLMLLGHESRTRVADAFQNDDAPKTAITLGIGNILSADKIICVAWEEDSAEALYNTIEGKMTDLVPASFLQVHDDVKIYADLDAASRLTRISYPWKVTSCEWNDHLIRRAIVWLCGQTGKPILKLTNEDYNDYGLNELVALYGSAYNVNIKIFNDLQHTITGWPGGKPNADDSTRPVSAKPFPKTVLIFSPHPDDDVISMGGTFIRLASQGHDVHVAYETSGNVAVHDDVVLQHMDCAFQLGFADKFDEVKKLVESKRPGEPEPRALLEMKGAIRRSEARGAVRSFGLNDNTNAHFLNLPFYESGGIKKNPRTQADVDIIKDLIRRLKPHMIFMAGDLADPHGTHRVCTEAALEAMEQLKAEGNDWIKETHVWLYRGAWMEWELGRVDMAVPLSPDEVIMKRHAIFRHLSQKDIVPFPGEDPREFWQRAEERTQNTARLYDQLGMAEYQAIEVFLKLY